jgi:hypothetical protein
MDGDHDIGLIPSCYPTNNSCAPVGPTALGRTPALGFPPRRQSKTLLPTLHDLVLTLWHVQAMAFQPARCPRPLASFLGSQGPIKSGQTVTHQVFFVHDLEGSQHPLAALGLHPLSYLGPCRPHALAAHHNHDQSAREAIKKPLRFYSEQVYLPAGRLALRLGGPPCGAIPDPS